MAPTTTVRVHPGTRDILTRLSEQRGLSTADLLAELVEQREQDELLDSMNAAFERQRGHEAAWQAEKDERLRWESTLADGLDEL